MTKSRIVRRITRRRAIRESESRTTARVLRNRHRRTIDRFHLVAWGPTQRIHDQGEITQSCLNRYILDFHDSGSLLFLFPGDSRVLRVGQEEPCHIEGIHVVAHVAHVGDE
jgi:hypothetical protein